MCSNIMELSKMTTTLRWTFIISNVLFLILGCVTLSVGIAAIATLVGGDYDTLSTDNIISGAILLLVAGTLTVIVSVIGFLAAVRMWRPLFIISAIGVGVVIVIELIGGILGFVIFEDANDEIRKNTLNAIEDYRFDDNSTLGSNIAAAIETVQGFFECCGADNYTDWLLLNPDAVIENTLVPPARCFCDRDQSNCDVGIEIYVVHSNGTRYHSRTNIWNRGCLSLFRGSLQLTGNVNGSFGIVIAVLQVPLIVMAIILFRKGSKSGGKLKSTVKIEAKM